jgi:hypothetical protein
MGKCAFLPQKSCTEFVVPRGAYVVLSTIPVFSYPVWRVVREDGARREDMRQKGVKRGVGAGFSKREGLWREWMDVKGKLERLGGVRFR